MIEKGLIAFTKFRRSVFVFVFCFPLIKIFSRTFGESLSISTFNFSMFWDEWLRQRVRARVKGSRGRRQKQNERVKSWKISLLNSSLFSCSAFFRFFSFSTHKPRSCVFRAKHSLVSTYVTLCNFEMLKCERGDGLKVTRNVFLSDDYKISFSSSTCRWVGVMRSSFSLWNLFGTWNSKSDTTLLLCRNIAAGAFLSCRNE